MAKSLKITILSQNNKIVVCQDEICEGSTYDPRTRPWYVLTFGAYAATGNDKCCYQKAIKFVLSSWQVHPINLGTHGCHATCGLGTQHEEQAQRWNNEGDIWQQSHSYCLSGVGHAKRRRRLCNAHNLWWGWQQAAEYHHDLQQGALVPKLQYKAASECCWWKQGEHQCLSDQWCHQFRYYCTEYSRSGSSKLPQGGDCSDNWGAIPKLVSDEYDALEYRR